MKFSLFLATCWGEIAITSSQVAFAAGGFAVGIALCSVALSLRDHQFTWAPLYGSVLLLHPSWTVGLERDCGLAMRFLALAASTLMASILSCQLFCPNLSRVRFIGRLCLVSWAVYFAAAFTAQSQRLFGLADPDGVIISLIHATQHLLYIALALSVVCLFLWVVVRFPGRRSSPTIAKSAMNDRGPDLARRRRRILRTAALVSAVLLLIWVALYLNQVVGEFTGYDAIDALLAFVWGITLLVTATRGKFPTLDPRDSTGARLISRKAEGVR